MTRAELVTVIYPHGVPVKLSKTDAEIIIDRLIWMGFLKVQDDENLSDPSLLPQNPAQTGGHHG